jgi:hypothetical protein
MTIERRLDRLYSGLTASERATLILRAWKAGEDADPQVRRSTPDEQVREFNSLIRILRALNGSVAHAVQMLKASVRELPQMLSLLQAARLFDVQMRTLSLYISFGTREPITASDHETLVAPERDRYASLMELGDFLAARFDRWQPSDYEPDDDVAPRLKVAAWARVRRSEAARVRHLAEDGVLPSRSKGSKMTIHAGSFFRWLGEDVPVYSEWAPGFDVRPDDDADEVASLRRRREEARQVIATAAEVFTRTVLGVDLEGTEISWAEVCAGMAWALRDKLEATWLELLQMELVYDDAAPRFGDEDPAGPQTREAFEEIRGVLQTVHATVADVMGTFELPPLSDEAKAQARKLWEQILETED